MDPKPRPSSRSSPTSEGTVSADRSGRRHKTRVAADDGFTTVSTWFLWLGRLLAFAIVLIGPWWLGSVRQLPQLVMICMAMGGMTMLWFTLAFLKRRQHHFPWLAFPVMLGIALLALQTLSLPENVASLIAGKQSEMYASFAQPAAGELQVAGVAEQTPVRITMDLDGTRKSINLLTLALLCVLLGSYFFSSRKAVILLPLAATINGAAISIYGIFQRLKSERQIYGFIDLSDGGVPFGPFVNQNNAAGYLLICLACSLGLVFVAFNRHVAGRRPRQIITNDYPVWHRIRLHIGLFFAELDALRLLSLMASLIIAMGVVATLSRGGLLGLVTGSVVTAIYYSLTRRTFSLVFAGSLIAIIVFFAMSYLGFGEQLMRRLARTSEVDFLTTEVRMQHWAQTAPAIVDFAPFGSGVGSYDNVHRLYRSDTEDKIFYYAENQYFQTLVEAGVPGLLLLLASIVILGMCVRFLAVRGNSPKTTAVCVIGVFLLSSQAVIALFDFGLFIPANTVAMALVCGMLAGQSHSLADRLKKKYFYRFNVPISLNMFLLLLVFAGGLFATLDSYRYTRLELAMGAEPATENPTTTNLKTTDQRIQALERALASASDADAFRRLGELYILRFRLRLFDDILDPLTSRQVSDSAVRERAWLSTGLDRLHGYIMTARNADDRQALRRWREEEPVTPNLMPNSVFYLKKSRARSPLQPTVHLLLGQLHVLAESPHADQPHLARALELAPANAVTSFLAGLMDLQSQRLDDACTHLRKCLELDPSHYELVTRVALPRLSRERIIRDVLPEDAFMLFKFAFNHLDTQSSQPLRIETYRKAQSLLEAEYQDDRKSLLVLSDIQKELGNSDAAIKTLQLAKELNQEHQPTRTKLVLLLRDSGRYDEALEELRWIRRHGEFRPGLESLEKKIIKLREDSLFSN